MALHIIKAAMEGKAVTPAIALGLIKKHLLPLVPKVHQDAFHKSKAASWEGIYFIYVELGFCCEFAERPLKDVTAAINLIHSHTKKPPREFQFPTSIEVTYFFHVCTHLKVPTEKWRRVAGHPHLDPFKFCPYCWRQPLPRRALCAVHGNVGQIGMMPAHPISGAPRSSTAQYRAGARERALFDEITNRLLTDEVLEFHQSEFEAPFLIPSTRVGEWMSERRPAVWQALLDRNSAPNDESVISALLNLLTDCSTLPPRIRGHYEVLNHHFLRYPAMVWPMLLRAEALLRTRAERQQSWGGSRPGAGRRARKAEG